ncbi:MAG: DUF4236 domain-containing protein [Actinomycetota bacterium]
MAFRFFRRIRIAPGVTLNLAKSGGSLSFGPRGMKYTVGSRVKRATFGIPGTGLFYTTTFGGSSSKGGKSRARSSPPIPAVPQRDRLTLGFFQRLVTPTGEEALVDGCRELVLGNDDLALQHFQRAAHLADGACLAGFLFLQKGRFEEAEKHLKIAAEKHGELGSRISKYGVSAVMSFPITDEITAHLEPDLRGVLLGLAEVYQRLGRWQDALACLERLRGLEPDDLVVRLSLVELLWDARPGDHETYHRIVTLAGEVGNETPVHAALLLYKARALRGMGLLEAARETLSEALRRRKNRPNELLRALRYERALVYEGLGQKARARAELEKIFAEDPDYEDVSQRLGLG